MLAATLINVLPSKNLKWKSPFHIFYDKEVDYTVFHPFGCLCYYTATHPHKDKFEPRATAVVFTGFSEG